MTQVPEECQTFDCVEGGCGGDAGVDSIHSQSDSDSGSVHSLAVVDVSTQALPHKRHGEKRKKSKGRKKHRTRRTRMTWTATRTVSWND